MTTTPALADSAGAFRLSTTEAGSAGIGTQKECRGQDSNLGTPARADLESAAFGRSATPASLAATPSRLFFFALVAELVGARGLDREPDGLEAPRAP